MHWRDQRIIFTALGFVAVVMKDGNAEASDLAYRARGLAGLIEEFCRENAQAGLPPVDLDSAQAVEAVDQMIAHHVRELRQRDETALPDDRETLVRLYDRLQHRAMRREQAEFYTHGRVELMADRVLSYLDAEVAEHEEQERKASA